MKKIVALFMATFMLVLSVPHVTYAKEKMTPSGISYSNIGTEMDAYVDAYKEGLVSVATSVFDESGIIYTQYYGYSDIEGKMKADEETVYEWGSVSKLLVWVSVMQLEEQGKLDLETDIREYLPDGFLTKLEYEDETITMLNLMNHNAGFQESAYENQMATEDELYGSLEEAIKACECYQAYHVGEHTAYSNWGTALAAYIVERISGISYVDYVHQNIFEPLGMEHTSIDMHISDNDWVRNQREELKCYARYNEEMYNEDYGVCHSWVQLYPAGSAIGTIRDLAVFGQGFVATDCPFFVNDETREEMFLASSFYGDSDIAKNCHGLWTAQFKVQTLGHGGNTHGCTANLQFDPKSKLGIVVLTNEPGETMFATGLAGLLFGDVMDSELVKNKPVKEHPDMSGVYVPVRTIVRGFASSMRYIGGLCPVADTENPDVFDIPLTGGMQLIHIGDKMWLQKTESGMSMFTYESVNTDGNIQLEMMSTDMVQENENLFGTITFLGFVFLGMICIITLFIKLLLYFIRRMNKRRKKLTNADKQIVLQQIIQGISGIILFCLTALIGPKGYVFAVISCFLVVILAVMSSLNGAFLIRGTFRDKKIGRWQKVKQYSWAFLGFAYTVIVIWFQLYDFIHI